jgi:hypothetical protein
VLQGPKGSDSAGVEGVVARESPWGVPVGSGMHDHGAFMPLASITGNPYKVMGFRERILMLLDVGTHCLILSGGYGLLRPEELVHDYGAHMSATAPIWRSRLPRILDDYIRRNRIGRVLIGCSSVYREALRSTPWRNGRGVLVRSEGTPWRDRHGSRAEKGGRPGSI